MNSNLQTGLQWLHHVSSDSREMKSRGILGCQSVLQKFQATGCDGKGREAKGFGDRLRMNLISASALLSVLIS
jgi:hypothetical protein